MASSEAVLLQHIDRTFEILTETLWAYTRNINVGSHLRNGQANLCDLHRSLWKLKREVEGHRQGGRFPPSPPHTSPTWNKHTFEKPPPLNLDQHQPFEKQQPGNRQTNHDRKTKPDITYTTGEREPRPYSNRHPAKPSSWKESWIPASDYENLVIDLRMPDAPERWLVGFTYTPEFTSDGDKPANWNKTELARDGNNVSQQDLEMEIRKPKMNQNLTGSEKKKSFWVEKHSVSPPKVKQIDELLSTYNRVDKSVQESGFCWKEMMIQMGHIDEGDYEFTNQMRVVIGRVPRTVQSTV